MILPILLLLILIANAYKRAPEGACGKDLEKQEHAAVNYNFFVQPATCREPFKNVKSLKTGI